MHKKLEINWAKIKSGCQLGRKVVSYNSKSDLPLVHAHNKRPHCHGLAFKRQAIQSKEKGNVTRATR